MDFIKTITLLVLINCLCVQNGVCKGDTLNVIVPKPLHFELSLGKFKLNEETKIYVQTGSHNDLVSVGQQLSDKIFFSTGFRLTVNVDQTPKERNYILLSIKNGLDSLGTEGYELLSNESSVQIMGKEANGVFYGLQSFIQLLNSSSDFTIPGARIYDKPRFAWRGLMLDVGRYFYSVEFIKKMIDNMVIYKMNTFHWHLTDDQGWRIEIKKYPELTTKAAWRSATRFARGIRGVDENPHGGYYTQEEIKEVVEYAKARFVTVVPEIEMPGHSLAALSVFPELSCTGGTFKLTGEWGVKKDVFCAGNEKTFQFLEDVLTEVVGLFPGSIIHIGGDECPKDRWKACPKCQTRIQKEGLKDEHELQSYFIKIIENFLLTKNKNIIGWDEILDGGLAPNAMVMSWRGTKGGIEAAKLKHEVIMSPNNFMYLDYYQGEPHLEPYAIGNLLPIQKVYSYEPIPMELDESERKYIKGIQANVWTEFIHSPEAVEYMLFPRIAAVAEVGWSSPDFKNWEDFSRRLEYEFASYERSDINYAKSVYNVWCKATIDSTSSTAQISLEAYNYKPEIRYTLDGTEPTINSKLYTHPFHIDLPLTVKAATYRDGKRMGKVNTRSFAIFEQ